MFQFIPHAFSTLPERLLLEIQDIVGTLEECSSRCHSGRSFNIARVEDIGRKVTQHVRVYIRLSQGSVQVHGSPSPLTEPSGRLRAIQGDSVPEFLSNTIRSL